MLDDTASNLTGMSSFDGNSSKSTSRAKSYYAALALIIPVWAISLLSWIALVIELARNGPRLVSHDASRLEKVAVLWALLEVCASSSVSPSLLGDDLRPLQRVLALRHSSRCIIGISSTNYHDDR